MGLAANSERKDIVHSGLNGHDETNLVDNRMSLREEDLDMNRDLDLILSERAQRYNDPKLTRRSRELCLLVAVDVKLADRKLDFEREFTLQESLNELSELVGTAGLDVKGVDGAWEVLNMHC